MRDSGTEWRIVDVGGSRSQVGLSLTSLLLPLPPLPSFDSNQILFVPQRRKFPYHQRIPQNPSLKLRGLPSLMMVRPAFLSSLVSSMHKFMCMYFRSGRYYLSEDRAVSRLVSLFPSFF